MIRNYGHVKGRVEKEWKNQVDGQDGVYYGNSTAYVATFYAGKKNGRMIQLTFSEGNHIQLTDAQVIELIELLKGTLR